MKIARWLALAVLAGALFAVGSPAQATAPGNDNYGGAISVTSLPLTLEQDTLGATDDTNVSSAGCGSGATVWYKITPTETGPIVVHTRGSSYDTVLSYYDGFGAAIGPFPFGCYDDNARQRSVMTINARVGHTYFIQVGGFLGATGHLKLSLNHGGTLTGVVRNGATGSPVPFECVSINRGGQGFFTQATVTGFYSFSGLPGGEYAQGWTGCEHGTPRAWASPAYVGEGRTVTASDIVYDRGGVKGVVTDELTHKAVGQVCVNAVDASNNYVASATTTPTGYYELATPPGAVNVHFQDCNYGQQNFAPEYYNGAVDLPGATAVNVAGGVTSSGIDASLQRTAIVTGVVTEQGSARPVQSCVDVRRASDDAYLGSGSNFGSSTGFYRVVGFAAQPVVVRAIDCGYPATHAPEWFNDSWTRAGAQTLALSSGVTRNVNFGLNPGSRLTGVLHRDGGGTAVDCVQAVGSDGTGLYAYATPTGFYSFTDVAPGQYKIKFGGCGDSASEWYQDKVLKSAADPVSVTGTVTVNASLAKQGTAHGVINDPSVNKRVEVCASAVGPDAEVDAFTFPSVTGAVGMGTLRTARYTLHIDPCGAGIGASANLGTFDAVAGQDVNFGTRNITPLDTDGDGTSDRVDNCPLTPNADQADSNNDDLGNLCDALTMGGGGTGPKLSMVDVSVLEGNTTHALNIHVKLSAASSKTITVVFKAIAGTATGGSDFVGVNKTLTFSPGTIDVVVPVTIKGDKVKEPDETFKTLLSSPTNATIGRARAIVTLRNDD